MKVFHPIPTARVYPPHCLPEIGLQTARKTFLPQQKECVILFALGVVREQKKKNNKPSAI